MSPQRRGYLARFTDPSTGNECQFENHTYADCKWAVGVLLTNREWEIHWAPDILKAFDTFMCSSVKPEDIEHICIGKVSEIPPAEPID